MFMTQKFGRAKSLAALIAVPLLAFSLAACSPSNTGTDTNEPVAMSPQDWDLSYAECMRGEGIDVPDPDGDGRSATIPIDSDDERAALEAASKTCTEQLGERPASPAEDEKASTDEFLKFARQIAECYRENGYDVADPTADSSIEVPADASDEVVEKCGGIARAPRGEG